MYIHSDLSSLPQNNDFRKEQKSPRINKRKQRQKTAEYLRVYPNETSYKEPGYCISGENNVPSSLGRKLSFQLSERSRVSAEVGRLRDRIVGEIQASVYRRNDAPANAYIISDGGYYGQ